jgi:hypothetical protein
MLTRSSDRKMANSVTNSGNVRIRNTFGLPAGSNYSCPGMTSVCEKICYANRIERQYTNVMRSMVSNFDQLNSTNFAGKYSLIYAMISEFDAECDKWGAEKAFRIHWDGDFFSREYASAWAYVIRAFPDIQFWVYTRSFVPAMNVIDILADIPNLVVYLSVDEDNAEWAKIIVSEFPSIRIAALSDTMDNAANVITDIRNTNRPGAKCPELTKAIPLISLKGGACIVCQLCPKGKADIRFASTKAGRK